MFDKLFKKFTNQPAEQKVADIEQVRQGMIYALGITMGLDDFNARILSTSINSEFIYRNSLCDKVNRSFSAEYKPLVNNEDAYLDAYLLGEWFLKDGKNAPVRLPEGSLDLNENFSMSLNGINYEITKADVLRSHCTVFLLLSILRESTDLHFTGTRQLVSNVCSEAESQVFNRILRL